MTDTETEFPTKGLAFVPTQIAVEVSVVTAFLNADTDSLADGRTR